MERFLQVVLLPPPGVMAILRFGAVLGQMETQPVKDSFGNDITSSTGTPSGLGVLVHCWRAAL